MVAKISKASLQQANEYCLRCGRRITIDDFVKLIKGEFYCETCANEIPPEPIITKDASKDKPISMISVIILLIWIAIILKLVGWY